MSDPPPYPVVDYARESRPARRPAVVAKFVAAHVLAAVPVSLGVWVAVLMRDALTDRRPQNWALLGLIYVGLPAGVVLLSAAAASVGLACGSGDARWPRSWVVLVVGCDVVAVALPLAVVVVYGHP